MFYLDWSVQSTRPLLLGYVWSYITDPLKGIIRFLGYPKIDSSSTPLLRFQFAILLNLLCISALVSILLDTLFCGSKYGGILQCNQTNVSYLLTIIYASGFYWNYHAANKISYKLLCIFLFCCPIYNDIWRRIFCCHWGGWFMGGPFILGRFILRWPFGSSKIVLSIQLLCQRPWRFTR